MNGLIVATADVVSESWIYKTYEKMAKLNCFEIKTIIFYSEELIKIENVVDNMFFVKCKDINNYSAIKDTILQINNEEFPQLVVFQSNIFGDDIAARFGIENNYSTLIAVSEFELLVNGIKADKAIYNANLISTYNLQFPVAISLLEGENIDIKSFSKEAPIFLENLSTRKDFKNIEVIKNEQKEDISYAKQIIAIGRGLKNKCNVEKCKMLCEKLKYKIGGTRPVVLDGLLSTENMIGLSGKILHAKTVLCIGASGANAFINGIENCEEVIAINSDENALIFNYCDIGIIGDGNAIIEKMLEIESKGEQN